LNEQERKKIPFAVNDYFCWWF